MTLIGKTAFYEGKRRKILEETHETYLLRGRDYDKKELVSRGHYVKLEGVGHMKLIDCCVRWDKGKCVEREEKEEWIGYWVSVDLLRDIE